MSSNPRGSAAPRRRDAVERVFVLWIFLLIILVLAIIVVGVLLASRLSQLGTRLERIEARISALETGAPLDDNSAATDEEEREPEPREAPAERSDAQAAFENLLAQATQAVDEHLERDLYLRPRVRDREGARDALAAQTDLLGGAVDDLTLPSDLAAELAVLAALLDEPDEAQRFLGAARGSRAEDRYYEQLTRDAIRRADYPTAIALLEAWPAGVPATRDLLHARVARDRGDWGVANERLDRVEPDALAYEADRLHLADIALSVGRCGQANDALASLSDALPEALARDRARLAARLCGPEPRPVEHLARLAYQLDHSPADYDLHVASGRLLQEMRQRDAALEHFRRARMLNPGRPEGWYYPAVIANNLRRFPEATRLLTQLTTTAPRFAPGWEARGVVALHQDEVRVAINEFNEAIGVDANRAESHLLLAVAHAKLAEIDPARVALRRALTLDPTLIDQAESIEALQVMFTSEAMQAMLPVADIR